MAQNPLWGLFGVSSPRAEEQRVAPQPTALIRLRRIYNFWLFHANILQLSYTFGNFLYYFFGTNILIQCPVPVPVCCMFFVSQNIHMKWRPNGIKTDGDFFWNICEFWEAEPTWDDARVGHEAGGAPTRGTHALGPRGHSVRLLMPFFRRKKANIRIKIVSKNQPNRSYGFPGI